MTESTRYNVGDTFPPLRGYAADRLGALTLIDADEVNLILESDRAIVGGPVTVLDPPVDPGGDEGGPFNWEYDPTADDFAIAGSYTARLEIIWDATTTPPRRQTIPNTGLDRVLVGLGAWHPTVEQVAQTWVRARTYAGMGGTLAGGEVAETFTDDTTPNRAQAETAIEEAISKVLSHFARGEVPQRAYLAASHAATVYAALVIEMGYFPEQTTENSAFLQLRSLSDAAMMTLVHNAQVNDLFGEDYGFLAGPSSSPTIVGLGP